MTQTATDNTFKLRMLQLHEMLEQVQEIKDSAARETMLQIIHTMMEYHASALGKVLERIAEGGEMGQAMLNDLAQDELVGSLLLLYGQHPVDLETRVQKALENVRPYLAKHGGDVKLLQVTEDGQVHLKLHGNCHGCPSSSATIKNTIEQAIYDVAPDVADIQVDNEEQAKQPRPGTVGFVPVEQLSIGKSNRKKEAILTGDTHESA